MYSRVLVILVVGCIFNVNLGLAGAIQIKSRTVTVAFSSDEEITCLLLDEVDRDSGGDLGKRSSSLVFRFIITLFIHPYLLLADFTPNVFIFFVE